MSRICSYDGESRRLERCAARPPTVGAYERPLSLTTMTTGRSRPAAIVLSASQLMPPVSEPSPTTATTARSDSPLIANALASPSAYESAVEAWEFSTQSCGLSERDG